MKREMMFNLLLVLVLVLVLVSGSVVVHQARAQEPAPQGVLAPQADVSTAFTYQGRLTNSSSGDPVAGPCDFQFSLWDDGLTGSQVGSTQTKTNVNLDNGAFSAALDFGSTAFDGNARYLQIAVQCPAGGGGYTPLSGRVELTAAPYAHSLRPGAVIRGASSGNILSVENTNSPGAGIAGQVAAASGLTPLTGAGVWGDSASVPGVVGTSSSAAGVFGWSASNSGVAGLSTSGYGVRGESSSAAGSPVGVYGLASDAGSATSIGVQGKSNSTAGTGVWGEAPMAGVYGKATATTGDAWGVYGVATPNGYGVYGESASGHGVHGKATTVDGYGIYSEGDTFVEGEIFWTPKTSYVSVPAAAFGPVDETYIYTNWGNTLSPANLASRYYYAPVQLPHGAIVTRITFYWSDVSGDYNGHCYLYRNNMAGGGDTLGAVDTSGTSGAGSSETTTITNPAIDNSQYAYYVGWDLNGGGDVIGYGMVIEYTFGEPY
jgi:hypothetical protein